ncbi:MAG TPA: hypothetical protein VFV27_06045 [Nevskiaceae bacterium]|nr:hypothetical protein [Nevskiaceae bacterium]
MIRRLLPGSLLRRFSSAVVDQAVLSAANFVVGLLLIRMAEDSAYGYYVLVQSAIALLVSAQGAWILTPLALVAPKQGDARRDAMVGRVYRDGQRSLRGLVGLGLLLPPAGLLLGAWELPLALLLAAGLLAGWTALLREYLRGVLYIHGRAGEVLQTDLLYAGLLVGGVLLAVWLPGPSEVWAVLAVALAGASFGWRADRLLARDPGWHPAPVGDPVWRQLAPLGSWAAAGAAIYWLYAQGYNYLLALRFDVEAVAAVNAVRLLLMPTWVLTVGIRGLLTPSAARWLQESGLDALLRRLTRFILALAVLDLLYIGLVWIFRDWLTVQVLRTQIEDLDRLLLAWALVTLIALVRDLYQSALLALEQLKRMAWISVAGSLSALAAMGALAGPMGPVGVVLGMAVGELLSLIAGQALILRARRQLAQR